LRNLHQEFAMSRRSCRFLLALLPAAVAAADIIPGDMNFDGDVDQFDRDAFLSCMAGPDIPRPIPPCGPASTDFDADADIRDFAILQRNTTGCTAGCS
jgi:hypothetical protein